MSSAYSAVLVRAVRNALTRLFCLGVVLALTSSISTAQKTITISGRVLDNTGAAIANASVELRSGDQSTHRKTDDSGVFSFDALLTRPGVKEVSLVISASGFADKRVILMATLWKAPVEVRLDPAPIVERIEINANEERVSSLAGNRVSLDPKTIDRSGAITLDDLLRQAPGFSLFRRSGSLTANPTSQGVSLRGVGANGASRALVLVDGIPLNNPFGGWIYWIECPA